MLALFRVPARLSCWLYCLLLLLIAACAPQEEITGVIETLTPVETAASTALPTPDTTLVPTTTGPHKLVIWMPDVLMPLSNPEASALLSRQITAFETTDGNVVVDTRLKRAHDAGGILATLRSASQVAPGALPDLTLMRRDDMIAAVNAGLLQPLDTLISPAIQGDMYAAALSLGQVNNQLYGLPYALDVQHMVYRLDADTPPPARFEDLLELGLPFAFAAGRSTGMSDMLLAQYLAAGGTMVDGTIGAFNAEALLTALTFYESALQAGLIGPNLLDYTSSSDYQQQIAAGSLSAGVVTSRTYLTMLAEGQPLRPGYLPTTLGQPITIMDGWMWVLTSKDAARQPLAGALLNWLMTAERQGEYTRLVHFIPSQRSAVLRRWEEGAYATFISDLLTEAVLPLSESTGQAARAMQSALVAVVSGQRSAQEAVQDVSDQLGG